MSKAGLGVQIEHDCLFCNIPLGRVISQNKLAYAIYDGFPVTNGHALIIPKRHVPDFFSLTLEEVADSYELLDLIRRSILLDDPLVEGFNVGVNAGAVAGQTIFHCHIHLIPRRAGDVDNPRGGVRHLIPGKGSY